MKTTATLRQLMSAPGAIQAGGVGDAGQARLVEQTGYPVVYISGAYVNHPRGFPDGTLTLSEIATRVGEVTARVDVPVIADADEGFGGVLQIARTVREFERAGAAGLHMEAFATKKHGVPLPVDTMVRHLQVALATRRDPDFLIIARTDAMAPWRDHIQTSRAACERDAFERCLAYCEAGADAVMPIFASNAWIREFGPQIPKPLVVLGGMPKGWIGQESSGVVPEMTATELAAYNVKLVIYATNMLSRTHRFMAQQYAAWLAAGKFDENLQDERDRLDAHKMVGLLEKQALLDRFGD